MPTFFDLVFVDFHAEATSEKLAMGHYLSGKATCVFGTHTHVATADEEILENGTAYITDIGMTGPKKSVIGMEVDASIKRFVTTLPEKYKIADNRFVVSRNLDGFMHLSTAAKNLMINLSKCMSDLKYLAQMGKIHIPNIYDTDIPSEDLIFDFAKQISFYIVGNDLTISRSVESGILEANPYMPIICASLFESLNLIRRTIRTVRRRI